MSAGYGARVAVAEEFRVGGTCVIRGCVPKNCLSMPAIMPNCSKKPPVLVGVSAQPNLTGRRFWQIKTPKLTGSTAFTKNLEASGVEILPHRAELVDAQTVLVDGREISAERVLIVVGATPFIPDIPGRAHAITSNEAFHLDVLLPSITIVGGGYIAVEFAGIFNGLGVETTLVYRGEEILRGFDDEVRTHVHTEMAKKGITIKTQTDNAEIAQTKNGYDLTFTDGTQAAAGLVMYATGRVPNTAGLGLEKAGVKMGAGGEVPVDAYSQTNIASVYAVGDVTARAQLTPVAIREGAAFAETVYNDNPSTVDHSIIPTAVFSQPPIGTVGLTEAEARAATQAGEGVDIYASVFRPMKHTLSGSEEKTLMKLIVCRETDKVLGLHIVGPDSGEMIQAFGVAVTMGATKAQFDATIAVHPTAAEELVTFKQPRG